MSLFKKFARTAPKTPRVDPQIENSPAQVNDTEVAKTTSTVLEPDEPTPETRVVNDPPPYPRLRRKTPLADLEPYGFRRRNPDGTYAAGFSGNPDGPPPNILAYIRAMTGGGAEMIDHAIRCMRGSVFVRWEDEVTGEIHTRLMPCDPKHQDTARAFLKEQCPLLEDTTQQGAEVDYSKGTVEELRTFLLLQRKFTAPEGLSIPGAHSELPADSGSVATPLPIEVAIDPVDKTEDQQVKSASPIHEESGDVKGGES